MGKKLSAESPKKKKVKVGATKATIPAGSTKKVSIKLNAKGKVAVVKRSDAVSPDQRVAAAVAAGAKVLIVVNDGVGVQIVSAVMGPLAGGTIKVVDGPHNGITGEVAAGPEWGNIADER